jgi:hypothetical protein
MEHALPPHSWIMTEEPKRRPNQPVERMAAGERSSQCRLRGAAAIAHFSRSDKHNTP